MKIKAALSNGAEAPLSSPRWSSTSPGRRGARQAERRRGLPHRPDDEGGWPQAMSPIVLGHEGAGVVEAVGVDVTGVRSGDRVLLSYRSCGSAASARRATRRTATTSGRSTRSARARTARRPCAAATHPIRVLLRAVELRVACPGLRVQPRGGRRARRSEPRRAAGLRRADRRRRRPQRASARGPTRRSSCSVPAPWPVGRDGGQGRRRGHDHRGRPRRESPAGRRGARGDGDHRSCQRRRGRRDPPAHGRAPRMPSTRRPSAPSSTRRSPRWLRGHAGARGRGHAGGRDRRSERHRRRQDHPRRDRRRRGTAQFVPQLLDLHAEGRLPLEKLIRTYDFDDIDTARRRRGERRDDQAGPGVLIARGEAAATRTTVLPVVSPRRRRPRASGACSSPSPTVCWQRGRPSRIQAADRSRHLAGPGRRGRCHGSRAG